MYMLRTPFFHGYIYYRHWESIGCVDICTDADVLILELMQMTFIKHEKDLEEITQQIFRAIMSKP